MCNHLHFTRPDNYISSDNTEPEHHAMQKSYLLPNKGSITLSFNMTMADSEYGAVHMSLPPKQFIPFRWPSSEFTAIQYNTTVSCSTQLAQVLGSSTRCLVGSVMKLSYSISCLRWGHVEVVFISFGWMKPPSRSDLSLAMIHAVDSHNPGSTSSVVSGP